jgi:cobalamin biosynthesis protein CobW
VIKTCCNLLTGFLGSGKTTLLKYILQHGLQTKRVAIIMNEIGDIGIDGKVITGLEGVESMVEFNNGCVCCTIDDYRFAIAVQQIIEETTPDLLIIETTGLADPNPIVDRLKTASVARDAVITTVDAATFLSLSTEHEVLDEQVKDAAMARCKRTCSSAPASAHTECGCMPPVRSIVQRQSVAHMARTAFKSFPTKRERRWTSMPSSVF